MKESEKKNRTHVITHLLATRSVDGTRESFGKRPVTRLLRHTQLRRCPNGLGPKKRNDFRAFFRFDSGRAQWACLCDGDNQPEENPETSTWVAKE